MLGGMRLGFTPLNAMMLDVNDAFKLAVALNLDFIELAYDAQELLPASQDAKLVNELQRNTGVGVSVHLSYVDLNLASLMPGVRENSVARTNRGLEYAASVNAIVAVLHTGLIPLRHALVVQAARQKLEQSLKELTPLVPIALENLALTEYDLLRGAAQLEVVTKTAGFGNCLDVGHALVEGCTTDALEGTGPGGLLEGYARLEEYKSGLSNLIHLHLQDNDGTADQHRRLGAGELEWLMHVEWLRNFSGTVNLEVNNGPEDVRASVGFLRSLLA
jgi:sugar phosphate isomerase/epimerase